MNSDKDFGGKIRATIVIEILGRPPEHLTEVLGQMVKGIGEEKGVKIENQVINEPVLIEGRQDMFSTFAELDLELETSMHLVMIVFKYMPSHIEVTYPERLTLKNNEWNELFNEIGRRLHGYDEVAKIIQVEKQMLENKLRQVLGAQGVNQHGGNPVAKPEKKSTAKKITKEKSATKKTTKKK